MSTHKITNLKSASSPGPRSSWVPASAGLLGETWEAAAAFGLRTERTGWVTIEELGGKVREGLRDVVDAPLLRPSNIQDLSITSDIPFVREAKTQRDALGPGDVVVSKFLPMRAGWATSSTPRAPVDGNCIRIVGLDAAAGFWVAAALSHPQIAGAWEEQARGRTIPRIGLKDLKAARFPEPPPEIRGLAREWEQLVEGEASATADLQNLLRALIDAGAEEPSSGTRAVRAFFPASFLALSWLPVHVALRENQQTWAGERWSTLGDQMETERGRLRGKLPKRGRLLRLSDADGFLTFRLPEEANLDVAEARVYATPLRPQEVLLSLLGSAPKVVFHHPPVAHTVYVSDHWVRCPAEKNPGALALALLTPAVRWQLERSSSGIVRQFIAQEEISAVRLPPLPRGEAERIDAAIRRSLEALEKVRAGKTDVLSRVNGFIEQSLRRSR